MHSERDKRSVREESKSRGTRTSWVKRTRKRRRSGSQGRIWAAGPIWKTDYRTLAGPRRESTSRWWMWKPT